MELILSTLPKTWIFDFDGTLVVHNGHLQGEDRLLPGVKELFAHIHPQDFILILTARNESYQPDVERFMVKEGLRFNLILFDIPIGERVLLNDDKPSGLCMSYAIRKKRDMPVEFSIVIDETL